MNYGSKFSRLCLKLLLPTILTSSLPFYPYQKDERELPGYLLTRCSFFPLRYKALLAFPQMFSLYFYSYTILSDSLSLSLRLQRVVINSVSSPSDEMLGSSAAGTETTQKRNAHRILVVKPESKTQLRRPICKWDYYISIVLKVIDCEIVLALFSSYRYRPTWAVTVTACRTNTNAHRSANILSFIEVQLSWCCKSVHSRSLWL
jgi:hypothetical protein